MKNPEDILEEQSKRIFWVVQTVFSLLLARSIVEYKACILNPLSSEYYLTTLGLVLVYGTALWSWIDYSFSTIVSPYDFRRGKFEKTRFGHWFSCIGGKDSNLSIIPVKTISYSSLP